MKRSCAATTSSEMSVTPAQANSTSDRIPQQSRRTSSPHDTPKLSSGRNSIQGEDQRALLAGDCVATSSPKCSFEKIWVQSGSNTHDHCLLFHDCQFMAGAGGCRVSVVTHDHLHATYQGTRMTNGNCATSCLTTCRIPSCRSIECDRCLAQIASRPPCCSPRTPGTGDTS